MRVVTQGSFTIQLEGDAPTKLQTGDAFLEPAERTVLHFDKASSTDPAEIVCFYITDAAERPPIEMLAGESTRW